MREDEFCDECPRIHERSNKRTALTKDEQVLDEESLTLLSSLSSSSSSPLNQANCDAQHRFTCESKDYLYIMHQQTLHMLIIS